MTEIATEPASIDVSPVVGVVTFGEGWTEGVFSIGSLDDEEVEFTEQFNVQLVFASAPARITSDINNKTLLSGTYIHVHTVCVR